MLNWNRPFKSAPWLYCLKTWYKLTHHVWHTTAATAIERNDSTSQLKSIRWRLALADIAQYIRRLIGPSCTAEGTRYCLRQSHQWHWAGESRNWLSSIPKLSMYRCCSEEKASKWHTHMKIIHHADTLHISSQKKGSPPLQPLHKPGSRGCFLHW